MALSSTDSDSLSGLAAGGDDDEEWFEAAAIAGAYTMLEYGGASSKKPRKIVVETKIQWVERTLRDSDACYHMFRMRRLVFHNLHELLVNKYGLKSSNEMCSKEALGIFLWMCGAPQSVRQAKDKFTHSLETISRMFNEVFECVNRLAADVIKLKDPTLFVVHDKLQEPKFWLHFKNCIGAIDGTHIPVIVPSSKQLVHIGRHEYCSQNVMAVCDFDMRFTFVVTGWPGSAHDTRIFLDSLVKHKDYFPHPPEEKYYLVDSRYPKKMDI
ncbi:hypothetical protein U9M48_025260 [Paspalum notatum var. saurae]|uniref:DDE Tnp4 domain-containing protein n=1 Tax=Paspalum notatum var. saurae TaxID=547442 RepID=A0AAQ3TQD8_PASNO